jgi:hypothetical protein
VDLSLNGVHQVEVRYYERGGGARIRFSWQRVGDLPTPVPVPSISYASSTYSVSESAQGATITVVLSHAYGRPVTVDYAAVDGTASSGSDYHPAAGRLTFDPGVTSRTFGVGIIEDAQDEADETVILVLRNPGNATPGPIYQATLVIVDNDESLPVPQVQFGTDAYSVDEGFGIATINVVLSRTYDRQVTVGYRTGGGTADMGSDYESIQGMLVFEPGTTELILVVHILDDQQDEEEETIGLQLFDARNAVLGARAHATLVIVDNDTIVIPPPLPPSGNVPW